MQWNFLPAAGVNAPEAWANLLADHRPRRTRRRRRDPRHGHRLPELAPVQESPDFSGTRFVAPYDFVANNRFPLDREGHGTFVAGTIAETTNNGYRSDRAGVRRLDHAGPDPRCRADRRRGDDLARHPLRRHARRAGDQPQPRVLARRHARRTSRTSSPRSASRTSTASWWSRPRATRAPTQIAYPARAPSRRSRSARRRATAAWRTTPTAARGSISSPREAATTRIAARPELSSPVGACPTIYQLTFFDPPHSPEPVRLSGRLVRNLDGGAARRGCGGARDRQRRDRPPPDARPDPRAARADRAAARWLEAKPRRTAGACSTRAAATCPAGERRRSPALSWRFR